MRGRRDSKRALRLCAALAPIPILSGCSEKQSALAPMAPHADSVTTLTWLLIIGSAVIFTGVMVLAALAIAGGPAWRRWLGSDSTVVAGGIAFPIVVLSALLIYGLALTQSEAVAPSGGDPLRIEVVGERWWWRVIYTTQDGQRFESANELRIPVGRPVELTLTSADVIHSFWAPQLAGKLDMIPGRTNRMTFTATSPGVTRGQCAEYCGGAHAWMAFYVVILPKEEFARWMTQASGDARQPGPEERQGQELFLGYGCGACHTVRGTAARGAVGPDLTHVGSRQSLGAAALPNTQQALLRWLKNNQHIKPGNGMPEFAFLEDGQLRALSRYLASLE